MILNYSKEYFIQMSVTFIEKNHMSLQFEFKILYDKTIDFNCVFIS